MAALEFCCLTCDRIWFSNTLDEPCPSCGSWSHTTTHLDADPPQEEDPNVDPLLDEDEEERCDWQ